MATLTFQTLCCSTPFENLHMAYPASMCWMYPPFSIWQQSVTHTPIRVANRFQSKRCTVCGHEIQQSAEIKHDCRLPAISVCGPDACRCCPNASHPLLCVHHGIALQKVVTRLTVPLSGVQFVTVLCAVLFLTVACCSLTGIIWMTARIAAIAATLSTYIVNIQA